jgi:glycosyltransferase involved in cell wall biosynthesis
MAKTLIVEGWRFLPHSYAVVNQWQLLALKRRGDIEIKFVDTPYYNPKWQRHTGLFDKVEEDLLKSIPTARAGESADVNLRVTFPYNFAPSSSSQTLVFGTLEHQAVVPGMIGTAEAYEQARQGNTEVKVVTPSRWSADGFKTAGFGPERLLIIPHGVDTRIFCPMPEERDRVRRRLLLRPDDFVFLTVGAMTGNKGMDLLARAFGKVQRKYRHARLLLKGIDTLYNSKGMLFSTLETLLATEKQVTKQRIVQNMRYVGAPYSFREMALLYQAADAFVSPYRAEGFNIPALEAAACGLPVICTSGGPTDDFVTDAFARKINSRKIAVTSEGCACYQLDPDVEHLTALMMSAIEDIAWRKSALVAGPAHMSANYTWDMVADKLIRRLWV